MSPLYLPPAAASGTGGGIYDPSHSGMLLANWDLALTVGNSALLLGQVVLSKLWVPATVTVANLVAAVSNAGVTLTAGQNLGGLYKSDGTLIAQTADQSAVWTSTGVKTMALTAQSGQSLTLTGGPGVYVYHALLANGTTAPQFRRSGSVTDVSNQLLTADWRTARTNATGLTALPSPLGAIGAYSTLNWAGCS